jgi:histidyl-tRNA synthetase
VDVIGTGSLLCEVELVQIIDDIFTRFGLPVTILLNNRKILAGIAEAIGAPEMLTEITVALDKTDKIGPEKVNEELRSRGLPDESLEKLQPILALQGIIREKMDALKQILRDSETGLRGIEELCTVMTTLKSLELNNKWNFDMKLARGLSYYTGTIFEVKARDVQIGSICGGGRYDNLTGIFGLPGMSGVGISFGADRIYDVLSELKKFPERYSGSTRVLFVNFGAEELAYGLGILKNLRRQGIAAEIYPESVKLKKQFEYAGKKNIRWVAIAGKEEILSGTINLKNMETGVQITVKPEEIITLI